jgi:hypothetical protein
MKKVLLLILAISLMAGVATVWATVIGTPHDIGTEPCAMCHTPHSGMGQYPLWNRSQVGGEVSSYNMYQASISYDMIEGAAAQPRSPSSLCLVCHNGIASELVNYPGPCSNPDPTYDLQIAGCADLGTDLANDHPLSFNYNEALDVDLNGFTGAVQYNGSTRGRYAIQGAISNTLYPLYGTVNLTGGILENNWFECATCHAVHDTAIPVYEGKGSTQVYFLRSDNSGSQMCLDCHVNR